MRTSDDRTRKFSSTVGRILMAFVFVSMIGGISSVPAFGRDDHKQSGHHQSPRYKHYQHEDHRPEYRSRRHHYAPPVYAPPPLIYAPAPYQSPGINLFFPIEIR
jgi:hypothetical protein